MIVGGFSLGSVMVAVQHTVFHEIVKFCGLAGTIGTVLAAIFKVVQKLLKPYFVKLLKPFTDANETVQLLATNHIPHIQQTLNEHTASLASMRSDIRDVDTKVSGYSIRLDDTKKSVDSLNEAFLNHLDRVSKV